MNSTWLSVMRGIALATTALFMCGGAFPQDQISLSQQIMQAQRSNAQAMRKYIWKSRMEVRKNGESKNTQLFLMRYDLDGTLQKTLIGAGPKSDLPTRGIRGRVAQKRVKDLHETIEELTKLVKSYSNLPPGRMQDFLAGHTLGGSRDIQLQGKNILQADDSMTIWIDSDTHKQKRVELVTSWDTKPVHALSDFSNLPDGLNYVARTTIDYPLDQLQLISENFDYQRELP